MLRDFFLGDFILTDDTRDRVIVLETRLTMLEKRHIIFEENILSEISSVKNLISKELGEIKDILAMGRGGYRAVMWIGSAIVSVLAGLAWLYDHFR